MTPNPDYEILIVMTQKGLSAVLLVLVIVVILGIAGGVYFLNTKKDNPDQLIPRTVKTTANNTGDSTNLSNPASEFCIKVGGELSSEKRGDGGEYALCNFKDDMACEEWALYRRQCPIGGIKTIGFDTKEEAYCALTGGKTIGGSDAKCTLPNGKTCSNLDLYNSKCE